MMEVARAEEIQPLSADPPTKEDGAEIAPEFLIKHPLQNAWKLWYLEPMKGVNWEDMQKEITLFDTVEDFWSIYNHIKQASELKTGCDYSVFKSGIQPMWEHPANNAGGRWLVTLDKRQRSSDLDRVWLDVCLCLIGEAFDNAEDVNGAVVNVRQKQDKVAVWVRDGTKTQAVMEIGKKLKDKLKIGPRSVIMFQLHKDLYKPSSTTKAIYTL